MPATAPAKISPAETQSATAAAALPPGSGPLTRGLIESGSQWVAQADNSAWFLQLMSSDMSQPAAAETFINSAIKSGLDTAKLRAYYINTPTMKRLGVIYGEFATRAEALDALGKIPTTAKGSKPYPRQVSGLR
jgi:MSHA biogenesis protein MshM